jgi:hypothetical protein
VACPNKTMARDSRKSSGRRVIGTAARVVHWQPPRGPGEIVESRRPPGGLASIASDGRPPGVAYSNKTLARESKEIRWPRTILTPAHVSYPDQLAGRARSSVPTVHPAVSPRMASIGVKK